MAGRIDRILYDVALRHGGACRRQELLEQGLTRSAVDRRIRSGALTVVSEGVYLVAGSPLGPAALEAAALLAAPGGALARETAAVRHGFPLPPVDVVHVVVPRGRPRPAIAGVAVHETRWLPEVDLAVVGRRRLTSPARTLCDLAAVVGPQRLRHLVERQLVTGVPDAAELVACHRLLARRGRPGSSRMRLVLALLLDDEPFPESELELAMLRLLVSGGVEGVLRQHRPPWFDGVRGVVDFAHPGARVVIEVDGRRWHGTTQAHDEDRRRDRLALAHGWRVVRFGWQEVVHRSDQVRAEIERLLAVSGEHERRSS